MRRRVPRHIGKAAFPSGGVKFMMLLDMQLRHLQPWKQKDAKRKGQEDR